MLLESLHIPLTTPFHPDGRLFTRKLESNVARYSRSPAAGLIVLAPSSAPTLLSDDETREVLRTAESAAPDKVLTAGISRDSVSSTLTLAGLAATLEYDAVLIPPPSIPLSALELVTFFQTIADRSPLPIILSTTPLRPISLDLIVTLAAHPNIVAAIDAASSPSEIASLLAHTASIRRDVAVTSTFAAVTARMKKAAAQTPASDFISAEMLTENAAGLTDSLDAGAAVALIAAPPAPSTIPAGPPLRTRTKSIGFQLLAASTPTLLDALRSGASGIAPAFAACAPQPSYEVFAAWKDSDQPLADEKLARLLAPARLAESTLGLLNYACDLNGYFGGLPRPPLLPPTGEQRTTLELLLQPLRN